MSILDHLSSFLPFFFFTFLVGSNTLTVFFRRLMYFTTPRGVSNISDVSLKETSGEDAHLVRMRIPIVFPGVEVTGSLGPRVASGKFSYVLCSVPNIDPGKFSYVLFPTCEDIFNWLLGCQGSCGSLEGPACSALSEFRDNERPSLALSGCPPADPLSR